MLPKIVVILGPTAVGKSQLAVDLAEMVGAAIVNADSQQVYRYLDIGTAKPTSADRQRVAHYLLDVVDPDGDFSAALFSRLARQSIAEIRAAQKHALLCGGTGLYLKALTQGLFEGPAADAEIRRALIRRIENEGLTSLYQCLTEVDPDAAAAIHPHDRQRTIRALEVYQATGKRMSDWQREHGFREKRFDLLKIGLYRPRHDLYELIDRRCESMVDEGLLDEVRGLVARGYGLSLRPMRAIGYRQMGQVLEGRQGLTDALAEMKRQTRHLAKRQLTWFRRDQEIQWFEPRQIGAIIAAVKGFVEN